MKYDPNIHNRQTIRLKWYDYSKEWLYFITISLKDKLCLFWIIENNKNILFDSWKMIEKYWLELENKFNNIKLHEYIVMPNHFHWIIEIVGAIPCGCPDDNIYLDENCNNYNNNNVLFNNNVLCNNNVLGNHKGLPLQKKIILWNIIWWFKSLTTNKYIKMVYENKAKTFNKKLWQRNYYEHIIKNEKSYLEISEYINNNYLLWNEDKFYLNEI